MLPLRSPSFRQFKFVFLPDQWKIYCQHPNPIQLTKMNHNSTTPTGTMAFMAGPHPGVTKGGDRPLRGGQTPLTGGDCPLSGGDRPLSSGRTPLTGGDCSLSSGQTSLCSWEKTARMKKDIGRSIADISNNQLILPETPGLWNH